jgi:hypothetical protein
LTTDELFKLKKSIGDHKTYLAKGVKEERAMDSAAKLQDSFNQKLYQELAVMPSSDAKTMFLCQQNTINKSAFANYLLSLKGNQ